MPSRTFNALLAEAVADLAETGFVSPHRAEEWAARLRHAAERELGPDHEIDREVRARLGRSFERLMRPAGLARYVPGVKRVGKEIVSAKSRAELDRRIFAAADLIKLRRREAVSDTMRRLSGWVTSVPPGGDDTVNRREVKAAIGKPLEQYSYAKRRCEIDQNHKLIANVAAIVAEDHGAIAAVWHSHGEHDKSYDARKEHLARAEKVYLIRDSWAHRQGLAQASAGYTDEIDAPAQLPMCRCFYAWITTPRRLPDEMLTTKGREWMEKGRAALREMVAA